MENMDQEQALQVLEYFASKDKRVIDQRFKDYVDGDRWKCAPSPTGAHHWLEIEAEVKKGISKKKFLCKYCEKHRLIIRDYEAVLPWGGVGGLTKRK